MASSTSRRTARRRARAAGEARREAVNARYNQRVAAWRATQPAETTEPYWWAPGMPRMSRREREAAKFPSRSTKQSLKHLGKRTAKIDARRDARRAHLETVLAPLVAETGMVLLRLDMIGSYFPMVAHGTVHLPDAGEMLFAFRYRSDRAFLEIGQPDADYPELVGDALLVASRDNVTGDPYAGELPYLDAVTLLGELFAQAHSPETGERFGERFVNTLDLLLGRGGDPMKPTVPDYLRDLVHAGGFPRGPVR